MRELRRASPALLRSLAAGVERDRVAWSAVLAHVIAARVLTVRWSGPGALAAAAVGVEIARRVAILCSTLSALHLEMVRAAGRLDRARQLVRRAEVVARAAGGWLDDDGRLVLPGRGPIDDPLLEVARAREHERTRWEVDSLVERALANADEVDRHLARALAGLRPGAVGRGATGHPAAGVGSAGAASGPAGTAGVGEGRDPVGIGVRVPAPWDPASWPRPDAVYANAAWWQSLSDEERRIAITEHPEWVGPRDGVPGAARDAANRILLQRARRDVVTDLGWARREGRSDLLLLLAARRQALESVASVLAQAAPPPRQLLMLDPRGGAVKAAVSVGDVDTAGHLVTWVGGLSTTVRGDLGRRDRRFSSMREKARAMTRAQGDAGDVAIITWLGYPAPQWAEVLSSERSVLGETVAREGALDLADFVIGLDAAREVRPHQTVWAHSYGSLTAGHALLANTGVDDVVFYGSPGTPIHSLADAGLKAGAFNVIKVADLWPPFDVDVVALSGWFVKDPAQVAGAAMLSREAAPKPGSNVCLARSTGHSEYDKDRTTSEHNLVAVAAGRSDLRVRAGAGRC